MERVCNLMCPFCTSTDQLVSKAYLTLEDAFTTIVTKARRKFD